MSRNEKKMNDKLDDERKLAGLEALVPQEREKHLLLNSKSLANFRGCASGDCDVREATFGLIIRDSKPSDTGARGMTLPQAHFHLEAWK